MFQFIYFLITKIYLENTSKINQSFIFYKSLKIIIQRIFSLTFLLYGSVYRMKNFTRANKNFVTQI